MTDFMMLQPKVKVGGCYPLILGRIWLEATNSHINFWLGNMVISNGEKTKQLTLYPPTQPLLVTNDLAWVENDLKDSMLVLTIKKE